MSDYVSASIRAYVAVSTERSLDDPQRQLTGMWPDPAELGGIAHEP
jgi:hypothetical protein